MKSAWLLALVAAGCTVALPDYRTRACDATHPCVDGYLCVSGFCAPPDAGTSADAGVRWRQWVEGFSGTSVTPAGCCALNVGEAAGGNVVVAADADAGGQGFAVGSFSMPSAQGQIQGHFTVPSSQSFPSRVTFAQVFSGAGPFLSLGFSGDGVEFSSPAGALQSTEATAVFAVPGGITAGADYRIAASWVDGSQVTVSVNGSVIGTHALGAQATVEPLTGIDLGASSEAVTPAEWSVTLGKWQVSDDPSATLPDP